MFLVSSESDITKDQIPGASSKEGREQNGGEAQHLPSAWYSSLQINVGDWPVACNWFGSAIGVSTHLALPDQGRVWMPGTGGGAGPFLF